MSRFEAAVSVGDARAEAGFIVADGNGSLVGACIIPRDGETMDDAIEDFTEVTGCPLLLRRYDYGPEIPADFTVSDTARDEGLARKSSLTFRPGKGCTPAQLSAFLGQCRAHGITADVAIWPEMHRFMSPLQYRVLCQMYVPAIREHGYRHVMQVTNYSVVMRDSLAAFWPGDSLVDRVGVVFYPSGLSLAAAARFADDHGKPLGLAEFGADLGTVSHHDALAYMTYIQEFFGQRIADGRSCGDLVWTEGWRDGEFRLGAAPGLAEAYRRMFDTLTT